MKVFKEIFGRIWALWATVCFLVTMIIFMIPFLAFCYFEKEPLRTRRFISFARVWMDVFLAMIGCPLSVKGREYFQKDRNYIVLCNHNSFMDVPISSPSIPGGNKTIAKIEMSRIPLFGMLYKSGSVLVDRKKESSRKESYGKMKEVLAMGLHMCIYPEGTRNKSALPLKNFHSGAFRLSIDTGKEIIPAIILHTRKVLPATKTFYAIPHRLEIVFMPPVSANANENAESFKERVRSMMTAKYYSLTQKLPVPVDAEIAQQP